VDKLKAEGLAESEALTLAMTKVTVVTADAQHVHLIDAFPTGDTADVTITLSPAASGDPIAPVMASSATPNGFTFSLRYQASPTALLAKPEGRPPALREPEARLAVARAPQPVTADLGEDKTALEVFEQATVTEATKAVFDQYVEMMQKYLEAEGTLDQFVEGLKAVGSIFEAEDLKAEYGKMSLRIDALERCAKNPTNGLTIKAYQQDPSEEARILQQVEATRIEIKANVAAQFLGILDSLATDLTKNPLLGILTGVGTSMTKDALDTQNEQRMGDLEKAIVECKEESPSPPPEVTEAPPSNGASAPDETPGSSAASASAQPPTMVRGTITWNTSASDWTSSGSITFIGKAFMDIGDYQVQPGSTYVDDFQQSYCDNAHHSGVLEVWAPAITPKAGVGRVNLVGGAGAPVTLFLALNGDEHVCGGLSVPYVAAPDCSRVLGTFDAGTSVYEFSCELRSGASGSVHGTLTATP